MKRKVLRSRFLIWLVGRARNPLHPQALRLVDIHPGLIIFDYDKYGQRESGPHTVTSYPFLVYELDADGVLHPEWRVDTLDSHGHPYEKSLAIQGIAPIYWPFHYLRPWDFSQYFFGHAYALPKT